MIAVAVKTIKSLLTLTQKSIGISSLIMPEVATSSLFMNRVFNASATRHSGLQVCRVNEWLVIAHLSLAFILLQSLGNVPS